LALLPYFLVYRALVRCKVALLRWEQHQNPQDLQEAESYASLAENYSQPKPNQLLITHGYSGSGKSTFSAQIAENLGIIHLRSDIERKRLIYKPEQDQLQKNASNEVNQGLYTPDNVLLVYRRLAELASALLDSGFSVLIDAAFLQARQRELFAELAVEKQVDFLILDFWAPEHELKQRVSKRQQSGSDASEATLAVLEHQLKTAQGFSATEQDKVILIDTCAKDALNKLLQCNRLFRTR
jgi:predicted kinase